MRLWYTHGKKMSKIGKAKGAVLMKNCLAFMI